MSVAYADIFPILMKRANAAAKQLRDIASISITVTMEKTPVQPMQRDRRATGFTSGSIKVTYEMESAVPLAGLEVDWWQVMYGKEEFSADIEMGDGGVTFNLVDAVVDSIVPSTNGEGQAVARISGKATYFAPAGSSLPSL